MKSRKRSRTRARTPLSRKARGTVSGHGGYLAQEGEYLRADHRAGAERPTRLSVCLPVCSRVTGREGRGRRRCFRCGAQRSGRRRYRIWLATFVLPLEGLEIRIRRFRGRLVHSVENEGYGGKDRAAHEQDADIGHRTASADLRGRD